jgi:hypothetical protein
MLDGKLNNGEMVFLSCPKCNTSAWWKFAKHPKELEGGWRAYICLTCKHSFKAKERVQTFYVIEELKEGE